jgi:hypothetical protein
MLLVIERTIPKTTGTKRAGMERKAQKYAANERASRGLNRTKCFYSQKDEQCIKCQEICKRFLGRSTGAVKVRYYTLHRKD